MDWVATSLAVAAGGGLGGAARAWLTLRLGGPRGTLAVNTAGMAAMGAALARLEPGSSWAFVVTGGLGGFTTVSALALTVLARAQSGARAQAAGYLVLTLGAGLAALALGAWAAWP